MSRADQHPFVFYLGQPAQQELPEPPRLLDLPEHRLDGLLAQPIRAVVALAGQLLRHRRKPAARLCFPRGGRLGGLPLPGPLAKPSSSPSFLPLQISDAGWTATA